LTLLANKDLEMMQDLLHAPGYPEVDEEVSSQALEFWNQLIEYVEELIAEYGQDEDMIELGKAHTLRMVQQLCVKVRSPSQEQWQEELDTDQRRAFRDFRVDCKDTIQSAYRILGNQLFQMFAEMCLQHISSQNWFDLESCLFCLTAIGSTDESNDQVLKALFEIILDKFMTTEGVEERTLRTATDLIGVSIPFFRRNPQLLPIALSFLFNCLQNASKPDDAARAIHYLCDGCRRQLVTELPIVLQQYDTFISKPTATQFAIEKLSGAVSFLLESLPDLKETVAGTKKLLEYVNGGINRAKHLATIGQVEEGRDLARVSMHCLSSIASALRAPTDIPIDLDGVVAPIHESVLLELKKFQSSVFEIIATVLNVLSDDGEIIEEICNVFKAGFTEPPHFPFHFPPDIVYQFFSITEIVTTNLEAVLRMICTFLRSQDRLPGPPNPAITGIIQHLATLIQCMAHPDVDAEITQSLIEVLERCMPHSISILLHLQPPSQVEEVLNFTILALQLSEPLPKRIAANFWVGLLNFLHMSYINIVYRINSSNCKEVLIKATKFP
jgi:hypothetical protein